VGSADLAVNALLTGQQEKAIAALAPAQQLQVAQAKKKVDLLREAAQGGLGLGSGGKMARGQQVHFKICYVMLVTCYVSNIEFHIADVIHV
jgi:hypothetical protein